MVLEMTAVRDISIIMIPQRFDAGSAPGIESDLKAFLAGALVKKMIFDFSRTDYIASAGLKVILMVTRDLMKSGGRIILIGLKPSVYGIFEMAGFTSIFSISPSREDAIQKLS